MQSAGNNFLYFCKVSCAALIKFGSSFLPHSLLYTKLNNKFSRKCGYPTIHSSSKTSQLNGIQSENFYEMDKFWHLMVCMIDPWGRLIYILFSRLRISVQIILVPVKLMNFMSGLISASLDYRGGYISYRFPDTISIINDGSGSGRSLLYISPLVSCSGTSL